MKSFDKRLGDFHFGYDYFLEYTSDATFKVHNNKGSFDEPEKAVEVLIRFINF